MAKREPAAHSRLVLFALLLVIFCGPCLDAHQVAPPKLTGLFGRLEYHKESGDLGGLEVFVMRGLSGYVAVVQIAEGAPADPLVVPITLQYRILSFEVRAGNETLRYRGTVRPDGLYGKFDNGAFSGREDGLFLLKRGRSYWQE